MGAGLMAAFFGSLHLQTVGNAEGFHITVQLSQILRCESFPADQPLRQLPKPPALLTQLYELRWGRGYGSR
ncbi:hypothetical protein D3C76_1752910 [compost metagenome]